eukprot:gene5777-4128_t
MVTVIFPAVVFVFLVLCLVNCCRAPSLSDTCTNTKQIEEKEELERKIGKRKGMAQWRRHCGPLPERYISPSVRPLALHVVLTIFILVFAVEGFFGLQAPCSCTRSLSLAMATMERTQEVPSSLFFPPRFSPMPTKDQSFRDELTDPLAFIPLSEMSKEDLRHLPLVFNLGYQMFAGLQLSVTLPSGVRIGAEERQALDDHLRMSKKRSSVDAQVTPHTLLPTLIFGNRVQIPLALQPFTDHYFVQHPGPAVFRQELCTLFIQLMHIPGRPPLVVDLQNADVASFTLRCLYFSSHALQTSKRKFVLLSSEGDHSAGSTLFYDIILRHPGVHISYLLEHPLLAHWYGVNGNVQHPKFTSLPIGFLFPLVSGTALEEESAAYSPDIQKTQSNYTRMILQGLRSPAVLNAFTVVAFPTATFSPIWGAFAFVASPIGVGFECYRTWESMAFGAIPIIQNPKQLVGELIALGGAKELRYGHEISVEAMLLPYEDLPVVIVDSVENITIDRLEFCSSGDSLHIFLSLFFCAMRNFFCFREGDGIFLPAVVVLRIAALRLSISSIDLMRRGCVNSARQSSVNVVTWEIEAQLYFIFLISFYVIFLWLCISFDDVLKLGKEQSGKKEVGLSSQLIWSFCCTYFRGNKGRPRFASLVGVFLHHIIYFIFALLKGEDNVYIYLLFSVIKLIVIYLFIFTLLVMRRKRSMRCTVEPSSAHPVASAFSPSGVRRWACVASLCVLLLCLPLRQSHHVQNLILSAPDPFPSHTFRPHAALLLAAAGPIRVEQERTGEGVRYGVAYGEDDNDRSHEDSEEEDRDSGSSAAHSNEDLPPTTPSTPLGNERKNAHGTDGNLPQQKKSALVDDELEEWKGGDDTANATAQPKRVVSKVRRSRSNRRRRREARESSPSRRPTGKGAQQQPSKVMNAALEDFIGDASENEPMPEIPLERGNSSRAGQGETREWASTTPTPGWDREPVPPRAEPRHSTVTPLAVDFSPAPAYDEKFPDEAVDFGELIYHADLTREDLLHNPLVFNVGFLQYFGIQLSAYAINGVYMNDYERAALEEYLIDMEEIDPVEIRADEFLSKTTDGDSVNDYPDAYVPQIMDRYIVEQIGHGVFKNAFCEHFVKLMQIPDMPPLIVNMYNLQPGRFSRRCLYYRTEQLKSAKRKFVLLVSEGDYATTSSFTVDGEVAQEHDVTVSYLLNHPLLAHWYGVNGNIRHPKFTPVPLGFSFFHRSGRSLQSYDHPEPFVWKSPAVGLPGDINYGHEIDYMGMAISRSNLHPGMMRLHAVLLVLLLAFLGQPTASSIGFCYATAAEDKAEGSEKDFHEKKYLYPYLPAKFEIPTNFNYDESIEDMYTHQRVPHPEISREDILHTPLVSPLGYQAFIGLQVSSYTTSGVQLSPEERSALGNREVDLGVFNRTRLKARELFEELIRGDSVREPFGLSQVSDLYYKQQVEGIIHQHFCDRFIALLHAWGYNPLVVHLFTSQIANFTYHCLYDRNAELQDKIRKFVIISSEGEGHALSSFQSLDPQAEDAERRKEAGPVFLLEHPALVHWYTIHCNIRHPKVTALPKGFLFYHRSGKNFMPFDPARRYKEEYRNKKVTELLFQNLSLSAMFPKAASPESITFGHYSPLFLENALEVFTGGMLYAPGQWANPAYLTSNLRTVYIVLTPLNPIVLDGTRKMSLTSDVMVMTKKRVSHTQKSVEHIAFIPFTAALHHKLIQHPHGEASRELKVLVAPEVGAVKSSGPLYEYLKAHPELSHMTSGAAGTEEYYAALNRFAFVACPLGESYDSSCIWEALVFGAIPLVEVPNFSERMAKQLVSDIMGTSEPQGKSSEESSASGSSSSVTGETEAIDSSTAAPPPARLEDAAFLDVFNGFPVIIVTDPADVVAEKLEVWRAGILSRSKKKAYKIDKYMLENGSEMNNKAGGWGGVFSLLSFSLALPLSLFHQEEIRIEVHDVPDAAMIGQCIWFFVRYRGGMREITRNMPILERLATRSSFFLFVFYTFLSNSSLIVFVYGWGIRCLLVFPLLSKKVLTVGVVVVHGDLYLSIFIDRRSIQVIEQKAQIIPFRFVVRVFSSSSFSSLFHSLRRRTGLDIKLVVRRRVSASAEDYSALYRFLNLVSNPVSRILLFSLLFFGVFVVNSETAVATLNQENLEILFSWFSVTGKGAVLQAATLVRRRAHSSRQGGVELMSFLASLVSHRRTSLKRILCILVVLLCLASSIPPGGSFPLCVAADGSPIPRRPTGDREAGGSSLPAEGPFMRREPTGEEKKRNTASAAGPPMWQGGATQNVDASPAPPAVDIDAAGLYVGSGADTRFSNSSMPVQDRAYTAPENDQTPTYFIPSEVTPQDYLHTPFPYSVAYLTFAGLDLTGYSGEHNWDFYRIAPQEEQALLHYWSTTPAGRVRARHRQHQQRRQKEKHSGWLTDRGGATKGERSEAGPDAGLLSSLGLPSFFAGKVSTGGLKTSGDPSFFDIYALYQPRRALFRNSFCDVFVDLMSVPNQRPLVVNLLTAQTSQFTLWCLYFRSHALNATAKRKFVLVTGEGDETAARSFFSLPEIRAHPSPKRVMEERGVNANLMKLMVEQLNLNHLFPYIQHQLQFGAENGMWDNRILTAFAVYDWRRELFDHLSERSALSVVLKDTGSAWDYYRALQTYTFVASPMGFGYECHRTWEALAFGAIPILIAPSMVFPQQMRTEDRNRLRNPTSRCVVDVCSLLEVSFEIKYLTFVWVFGMEALDHHGPPHFFLCVFEGMSDTFTYIRPL